MDTDNDPHYGRRLKGTPAYRYFSLLSAKVLAVSAVIGAGSIFLANYLKSSREKKPNFWSKFLDRCEAHFGRLGRHLYRPSEVILDNPDESVENESSAEK